jgi:hypothetical protein
MIRNRQKKEGVKLNSPQELDTEIKRLQIEKSLLLNNMFYSNSPEDIMKAQAYAGSHSEQKSAPKAYFFAPDYAFHSGKEYKDLNQSVPDNILRKISYIHIIDSIINTKINQVMEFMKFTTEDQREGYTIQKKISRFEDRKKQKDLSESDKKMADGIVDFLEDGGMNAKWDIHDDLRGFVGKVLRDTFTFNRVAFELERNMKNELIRYIALDAQTIRLLETIDPFFVAQNYAGKMPQKEYEGKSYYPRYCQIWNGQIVENPITKEQITWYPWQLAFEMRNPSTDIWRNGYPASEIEVLSNIITGLLNGLQYNLNFFSQGSNPKGLLNVKNGDGGGQQILNQLRQMWSSSIAGVNNAHRMPVVEGLELEWIDMQHSNKDMEFQLWNEFLIVLTCSVFTIDPSELGFQFKSQASPFGQDGQKERLDHSKDKGLKPILVFLQKIINKYIVSELSEDYEFKFCGIDIEDETQFIDNDVKKINGGFVSLEDMFEKYSSRKLTDKDTILNPIYSQQKQMEQQTAMYGGGQSNEAVDQQTGEPGAGQPNPFDEYDKQKSDESDPIWGATKRWLKEQELIK